ncbi:hypothetical protein B0H13DRAFT_2465411 [Mycena leptocephala]|nr:hypothetical protein B0H13DRAFT_2465411 [Mycena leptocephala]
MLTSMTARQTRGRSGGLCGSRHDECPVCTSSTSHRSRLPPAANEDEDNDGGASDERKILGEVVLAKTPVPSKSRHLSQHLDLPHLVPLIRRFLYLQDNPDHDLNIPLTNIHLDDCPDAPRSVKVFPSAIAKFYAPSDESGMRGMLHEHIRAGDPDLPGFRGLLAARVLLFMSFKHLGITYPCALVTWFSAIGDGLALMSACGWWSLISTIAGSE